MKTLTAYRARFWARFPRLSYWLGATSTRAAIVTWVAAGLCGEIADGSLTRKMMWLPAMLLALITIRWLYHGAVHAALCPCVTAAPQDTVPADAFGEVED